jgi:hypothetical protein
LLYVSINYIFKSFNYNLLWGIILGLLGISMLIYFCIIFLASLIFLKKKF